MKIIFIISLIMSGHLEAKSIKEKKILCAFPDRTLKIDLSQKYNLNNDFGYKVEFFYNNINFGYCMLKIEESFYSEKNVSDFNLINFSKNDCKYISEKQSKDIVINKEGFIKFNNEHAFVDLFYNKQPLKCKIH